MNDQILAEVVRLHEELARWLGSEAEPEVLETFREMQRPEFSLVTVDGERVELAELMDGLAGARNAVPGLRIGIEEFEVLVATGGVAVCRFLERHIPGGARRVSAVLVPDTSARYGVRWLSVHETAVN